MPARKSLDHLDCSLVNSVDVFGDRWSLLILRDSFFGVRRFEDFQRDLGIARNVLSDRLRGLVDAGILRAVEYQDNPPRHEYRLTEKGRDLYDVLMALWRWGDRWHPSETERVAVHRTCGAVTHLVATCSHCGERLDVRSTSIEPPLVRHDADRPA